ncbi:mannosyltransferase [Sphingobium lactosutens]|uniref:glycosyltransferase family 4 protein n=1 Tax=Sphingobium lactosutens TaxID=522773 RepID=UPI0015BC4E07|nr:glycosyltransferase family 4 protein [Sphingobium lactosutens]NWK96405.1 mannosyltransferase [Sphingobium lactosutens]
MDRRRNHDDRIRVAFPFAGSLIGGSHFSSLGLVKHLDASRFDPFVIVDRMDNPIADLFRDLGVPMAAAPRPIALHHGKHVSLRNLVSSGLAVPILSKFLHRHGIGLVHVNDGRTAAIWALPARLAGAKLVWHHRSGPGAWGLRFASPLLANAVISVSDFARGRVARSAHKSHVIHSPFDTQIRVDRRHMRDMLLTEINHGPSTRVVGFFGAMIARKRPLLFVEAIAALRRQHPGLPVAGAIFGEAVEIPVEDVTALAERLGVADAIHVMGFRSPGANWIAACDLLAIPAVEEPFGRTLVEAMIVGTPVVASRSGGNADALEGGRLGRLVQVDDADALAAGMAEALTCADVTDEMIVAARAAVHDRFGEHRHAEQVMSVYHDLFPAARPLSRPLRT